MDNEIWERHLPPARKVRAVGPREGVGLQNGSGDEIADAVSLLFL